MKQESLAIIPGFPYLHVLLLSDFAPHSSQLWDWGKFGHPYGA